MSSQMQQVDCRFTEVRTPGEVLPDVRHIVVARTDRLGDFVLTLPAVAALRAAYPEAVLSMRVAARVAPLARCVSGIDEVWEAAGSGAALRRRLRASGTDLVVAISRDASTAWAAWRTGVQHRIGTARRAYSALFNRVVDESRRAGDRHELEYALSFAHRCGALAEAPQWPWELPDTAQDMAARFCGEQSLSEPFVVLHPGSGGSCPRWPESHFSVLIAKLQSAGIGVVVSTGPGEAPPRVASGEPAPSVFDGDLPSLGALIRRAALVVGSSTGPIHLAASLGTPTLALHAPWRSCGVGRFGPYAGNGWALVATCPDADDWSRTRRERDGAALMATLQPDSVFDSVVDLLAR